MVRPTFAVACLLVVAFAVASHADSGSPLIKVRITGHLGDYTPFEYSGTGDLAYDSTTGQLGIAAASALGVNDFRVWLANGTDPIAFSDAIATTAGGALATSATAQAYGATDTDVRTLTGTFP